jgi:hypothetical protein
MVRAQLEIAGSPSSDAFPCWMQAAGRSRVVELAEERPSVAATLAACEKK